MRGWTAPVRLSAALVDHLAADGYGDAVLATCRCWRCQVVTEHTVADVLATARRFRGD